MEQCDAHPTLPNSTQQGKAIIMFEDVVKMPFSCSAATVGVVAFTAYVGFLQLLRFRR